MLRVQALSRVRLWPVLHIAVRGTASASLPVSPMLSATHAQPLHSHSRKGSPMCWSQVPSLPGLHSIREKLQTPELAAFPGPQGKVPGFSLPFSTAPTGKAACSST